MKLDKQENKLKILKEIPVKSTLYIKASLLEKAIFEFKKKVGF